MDEFNWPFPSPETDIMEPPPRHPNLRAAATGPLASVRSTSGNGIAVTTESRVCVDTSSADHHSEPGFHPSPEPTPPHLIPRPSCPTPGQLRATASLYDGSEFKPKPTTAHLQDIAEEHDRSIYKGVGVRGIRTLHPSFLALDAGVEVIPSQTTSSSCSSDSSDSSEKKGVTRDNLAGSNTESNQIEQQAHEGLGNVPEDETLVADKDEGNLSTLQDEGMPAMLQNDGNEIEQAAASNVVIERVTVEHVMIDDMAIERAPTPNPFPSPVTPDIGSIRRGPTVRQNRITEDLAAMARNTSSRNSNNSFLARRVYLSQLVGFVALSAFLVSGFISLALLISLLNTKSRTGTYDEASNDIVPGIISCIVVQVLSSLILLPCWMVYACTVRRAGRQDTETWIEMRRRDHPLPIPCSPTGTFRTLEAAARDADLQDQHWKKFLGSPSARRYVESIEKRIKELEGLVAKQDQEAAAASIAARARPMGLPLSRFSRRPSAVAAANTTATTTDALDPSGSTKNLLAPPSAAVPVSTTQASILTELCQAVAEPYSPLDRAAVEEVRKKEEKEEDDDDEIVTTPLEERVYRPPAGAVVRHKRGVPSLDFFERLAKEGV